MVTVEIFDDSRRRHLHLCHRIANILANWPFRFNYWLLHRSHDRPPWHQHSWLIPYPARGLCLVPLTTFFVFVTLFSLSHHRIHGATLRRCYTNPQPKMTNPSDPPTTPESPRPYPSALDTHNFLIAPPLPIPSDTHRPLTLPPHPRTPTP